MVKHKQFEVGVKVREIEITIEEFKEYLEEDPRLKGQYIEALELPQTFATGNEFLRRYVMEKSDFQPDTDLPSDWFEFSQLIEEIEVSQEKLKIGYDEGKSAHPPFLSRSLGT